MPWTMNSNIVGNQTCTQFLNTGSDQLLPTNAYQTSPFINNNTTQSQTITFTAFSSLIKTDSTNTATLTANSSSGLSVLFESTDTNIAIVTGNTLTALTAGLVVIKAGQAGNSTYDPATPAYCYFTISLQKEYTGPNTYIEHPPVVQLSCMKNYLKSYSVTVNDIRYTQYTGVSYGFGTGFHGAALVGNISGYDSNNSPVTNYSDAPITVSFTMSHADTSHVYKIYKTSGQTVIDPQPSGYPVTLEYSSGKWVGYMTSLSDIVVLDTTPPTGIAGGDPYIMSIKKVKTLIPNNWRRVRMLETNNLTIVANCDFLQENIIAGLHYINKAKKECMLIDPTRHKWTTDITYITSLEFIHKNSDKKLIINTLTGSIVHDNSKILYEQITSNKGLYSITHCGHYPSVNIHKFLVHFDEGHVVITVDNFWDDINFIELFLTGFNLDQKHDPTILESYKGELIEHSIDNMIECAESKSKNDNDNESIRMLLEDTTIDSD